MARNEINSVQRAHHRVLLQVAVASLSSWAVLGNARPAVAQVHVGIDVAVGNRYVWRGVTRATGYVAQPDIYIGAAVGTGFVTAGLWGSVELFEADALDLTDRAPAGSTLSEVNYWLEYTTGLGRADVTVGWTAYRFETDATDTRRTGGATTNELYGSAQLQTPLVTPKISWWHDVDAVRGSYLETSLDLLVPLVPSVYLGALAGWSAGQGVNPSQPDEGANFAGNGLTHVRFSAWGSYPLGGNVSMALAYHRQINRDVFTKLASSGPGGRRQNTKWWLSLSFSVVHPAVWGRR